MGKLLVEITRIEKDNPLMRRISSRFFSRAAVLGKTTLSLGETDFCSFFSKIWVWNWFFAKKIERRNN
jgi:hypothetical protein